MRLLIQRVLKGSVTVDGKLVGKVGKGLHILLGVTYGDTESDINAMVDKVLQLKMWSKDVSTISQKTWDTNVIQNDYDIIVVSQFTLYCHLKGNKPDFHKALEHEQADELYKKFVAAIRAKYKHEKIQTGAFGEYMNVELENDGPASIIFETVPKEIKPVVEPAK